MGELRATFLGNWALRVWRKAAAGERGLGWGARDRRTRPGLGSEGSANEAWAGERGAGERGLGVAGYGRRERRERPERPGVPGYGRRERRERRERRDSVLSSPARQDGTGPCDGRLPERVAARCHYVAHRSEPVAQSGRAAPASARRVRICSSTPLVPRPTSRSWPSAPAM